MALGTTYDFAMTRDQIIAGALRILGVIAQGQTPDASQISDSAEALNILLKSWELEGLPIWAIKRTTITLVAGDAAYDIGISTPANTVAVAKPLRIYQAWVHDTTSNIDVPMVGLTQEQYSRLGNKSTQGTPVNYYYETLRLTGNFYVFPVPDTVTATNKNIVIQYQAPFTDFDASTDEAEIPQELLRALKYNLAADLAFEYGYPQKDRRDLMMMAEQLKDEAFAFVQEEGSYFFQIDRRTY